MNSAPSFPNNFLTYHAQLFKKVTYPPPFALIWVERTRAANGLMQTPRSRQNVPRHAYSARQRRLQTPFRWKAGCIPRFALHRPPHRVKSDFGKICLVYVSILVRGDFHHGLQPEIGRSVSVVYIHAVESGSWGGWAPASLDKGFVK